MRNKNNIVFVKNKLITVDTILPILIELKTNYNSSSDIVVFDELAHKAINENIVIKDAIDYVGKEIFITKGIKNKIHRRIYLIKGMFLIVLRLIFAENIFHFGALDRYPLKALGILFRKNVYRFPGNAYNFKYSKYSKHYGNKPKSYRNTGNNCILFDNTSDFCKDSRFVFNITPPRKRKAWVEYIRGRSSLYLNRLHSGINFENGCFVIATGVPNSDSPSRKLEDPINDSKRLFIETINVLELYSNTIPILIKPHPLSDINLIRSLIANKNNMFITYLHPTLLAMHARAFIANQFSNILADAHTFGIYTIEYTNYNHNLLNVTRGESIEKQFVTHFINNDIDKFKCVISDIASCAYKESLYTGIDIIESDFFHKVANR